MKGKLFAFLRVYPVRSVNKQGSGLVYLNALRASLT